MTEATCPTKRRALYTGLAHGAIGLALLAVAASTGEPLVAIPALLTALIAFRGCPMCWVFGLIERGSQDLAPSAREVSPMTEAVATPNVAIPKVCKTVAVALLMGLSIQLMARWHGLR